MGMIGVLAPDNYNKVLDELRVNWRETNHNIEKGDILRWSKESDLTPSSFMDEFAIELSGDFFVGFLGWEFCDGVANALHGALLDLSSSDKEFPWAEVYWEFYLAFDHSEMEGPRDRELIREFLTQYRSIWGG